MISFFSDVLGIIVLYNTRVTESKTISSLNEALTISNTYLDVIVYDNSLNRTADKNNFKYGRLNIRYVHDPSNAGVSKAYNWGAKYADKIPGKKWVLLLDQDTTFADDLLIKFSTAVAGNPSVKLFCPILITYENIIFSPCKYYFGRGFPLKKVTAGLCTFKNISPVNSGMLIAIKEFMAAGMYNEAVKLDFSDFQFIEKFKKNHSTFFIVDSVGLQDFSNHESDVNKLNVRYAYFCDGAKNFSKSNFIDEIKYLLVAFMRAVTLSYRTNSTIYFKTFFTSYIKR